MKRFFVGLIMAIMFLGGSVVSASNADTNWTYANYADSGTTTWRPKDTNGNVYCYPQTGGSLYATVGASSYASGSGHTAASLKVLLKKGKRYTIINSVGAGRYARIKFQRYTSGGTVNTGKWSPDASADYNIVG